MIELLQTHEGLAPGCYSHLPPDEELRLICSGLARAMYAPVPTLSHSQVMSLNRGRVLRQDGRSQPVFPIESRSVSASGLVIGAGYRLEAYYCSVAEGTLTIYDNTEGSGTVAVAEFELHVGTSRFELPGPLFAVGCYAVLSDPAARLEMYFGRLET
jgi:hypothetical protein